MTPPAQAAHAPAQAAGAAPLPRGAAPARLHLTNIQGAGATRLLESLLPALLASERHAVSRVYAAHGSAFGALAGQAGVPVQALRRHLPNAVSRLLECLFGGRRYGGPGALLVLGDLPLRGVRPQTVFVQTTHLTAGSHSGSLGMALKYRLARWVFRRGARDVQAFIVQTPAMRADLLRTYPELEGRVHVVPQPAPAWVLASGLQRTGRADGAVGGGLRLFYPAAGYAHKNHRLLAGIPAGAAAQWPVERLVLTLAPQRSPNPALPWLHCAGMLSAEAMLAHYGGCDALLFLSTAESYGLPLVEAMFIGLPIVCADLPYARALCGAQALYFDPFRAGSLHAALQTLRQRLDAGWWPDWRSALQAIPTDWQDVADRMLDIACAPPAQAATPLQARS